MEYKTKFKISLKTKNLLTEENKLDIMRILRDRVEGYHCEFPNCIVDGEMTLEYIPPSKTEKFLIPPPCNE